MGLFEDSKEADGCRSTPERCKTSVPSRLHVSLRQYDKERLDAFAASRGLTTSALLRSFIERMPGLPEPDRHPPSVPLTTKITIRLTPDEVAEIDRLARHGGMYRATWLATLARANLAKQPMLTYEERLAVREAARQMAHVGRNLNQMARALNIDAIDSERPTLELLRELADQYESLKHEVYELIAASREQWSI